jgi:Major Facilitator Superfamily
MSVLNKKDGSLGLEPLQESQFYSRVTSGTDATLQPSLRHQQQSPSASEEVPEMDVPAFDKVTAENYKPKTLKFWLIMLSAFISVFLVALDRTILATAIPRITDDFKSLGDIGWYGSAYLLTTAAFQLSFGRIYRFYDLKWTFLICILIFEVGSAICGAAPNSPVFIFGRAVAGVGEAGITTGSMMTIIPMVPLHKRPLYQCVLSTSLVEV